MAKTYPFTLDPFQSAAIACIERRESVLVAAHTSGGWWWRWGFWGAGWTFVCRSLGWRWEKRCVPHPFLTVRCPGCWRLPQGASLGPASSWACSQPSPVGCGSAAAPLRPAPHARLHAPTTTVSTQYLSGCWGNPFAFPTVSLQFPSCLAWSGPCRSGGRACVCLPGCPRLPNSLPSSCPGPLQRARLWSQSTQLPSPLRRTSVWCTPPLSRQAGRGSTGGNNGNSDDESKKSAWCTYRRSSQELARGEGRRRARQPTRAALCCPHLAPGLPGCRATGATKGWQGKGREREQVPGRED